jgi:uncharacterized protein (DUF433 family)
MLPTRVEATAERCAIVAGAIEIPLESLHDSVQIDKEVRGGVPVIRGTRVPLSLVFAEVRDSTFVDWLAKQLELERDVLHKLFDGLSIAFDKRPA